MRRRFGRATGSLLCVWLAALALANDARAAFELCDLAGNWQIFRRWDTRGGHAPGWDALDATVNASGAPTSGSYVNSDADGSSITGGSLSLDASGRMDGSITLSLYGPITFERWQMDLGETAIAGTGTTTGNRAMLGLALRRGASYANADLIGNWTLLGFADEEVATRRIGSARSSRSRMPRIRSRAAPCSRAKTLLRSSAMFRSRSARRESQSCPTSV